MKSEISIKSAIYLRAAELVEIGWCTGTQARDASGCMTSPIDPLATQWCLIGALMRSSSEFEERPSAGWECCPAVNRQIRTDFHATWNNAPGRTAAEVAAKLREQAFKE